MIKLIDDLLTRAEVHELRAIAAAAAFVDGRISNPNSAVKHNLHLGDADAYRRSSATMLAALERHEDAMAFAMPAAIAPPLLTRYQPGMRYGLHHDAPTMQVDGRRLRSDISCTIFLSDPEDYAGGALRMQLGDSDIRHRGRPGSAILYPSVTLHEVEEVTQGERLVGITFIQSRVRDIARRDALYEIGEVAALEGLTMRPDNYVRLRRVQANLQRMWEDQ